MRIPTEWTKAEPIGLQRIVIRHVSPDFADGRFPIRAVPGAVIAVEADIFADGSDTLAAQLLYKHTTDDGWTSMAMAPLGNDRWGASFIVDQLGRYHYVVDAWIDPIATWQQTIQRKLGDGQRIATDLTAGAQYVDTMLVLAGGELTPEKPKRRTKKAPAVADEPADVRALRDMTTLFRDEARYDEAVSLAVSEQLTFYASRYPIRLNPARYPMQLTVDVERDQVNFSTWYCLFPRSAAREAGEHGTFRNVEALLPRLSGMGFDVLCLPPVHPIGITNRRGKNKAMLADARDPGDPYQVGSAEGGHDTIHSELGTVDDLKHLMAIAANYELELALDLSLQCSPDHPWVTEHPTWFRQFPDGAVTLDFSTDDGPAIWAELKRVLLVWGEWGIRIVRVDKPHEYPFDGWEWLIAEVKQVYPAMLFVAAGFCRPKVMQELALRGFDQSYTHFLWRNGKHEIEHYLTELTQPDMKACVRPAFWPATHDLNPYSLHGGHEPQFMIRYFLAATLSSNYGIYGPAFELMQHQPLPHVEEYLNAESYEIQDWDWDRTNKLTYLMGLVNRIRRENPALQQTSNLTFCPVSDDAIMAYLKTSGDNQLLMVVNTDAWNRRAAMVQVPLGPLGLPHGHTYQMHDLLTDAYYTWEGEWNYVELDPYTLPMHLLRIERWA